MPFYQKKQEEKKKREFEKRAKAFMLGTRDLILKYKCDWQAFLKFTDKGIIPDIRVADATEEIARVNNLSKNKK